MPQFRKPWRLDPANLAVGLSIFFIGLAKKVLVADSIGPFADRVFNFAATIGSPSPSLGESWAGALAYTLQIYFDFSAYSDMAIGLSFMLGIRIPINFHSPYKATSIIEFWCRWHISLSSFLKTYLYIPMGGNRCSPPRRYLNLMITMLLGGLWHGAGWTFVVWGGLHGLFLAANHALRRRTFSVPAWPARVLTFMLVVIAWVPFRADSLMAALRMWRSMVGLNGIDLPSSAAEIAKVLPLEGIARCQGTFPNQVFGNVTEGLSLIVVLLVVVWLFPNIQELTAEMGPALDSTGQLVPPVVSRWKWAPSLLWALVSAIAAVSSVYCISHESYFLYFQF